MARQLLLNTLTAAFGDLVEGLTEENLKVGVWSGEILLKNLRLNQKAIKKLNLPVNVLHGYIGSFRVSIPWARLTSESVSVEIENVVLIAQPADPMKWNPEDLRRSNLAAKRSLLEKATETAQAWNVARRNSLAGGNEGDKGGGGKEKTGYFAKLATRIADNLFVFLKNVHVRFEDSVSDPSGALSVGVIIQDFQIQSTTNTWEASFVSREEEKKRALANGQVPAIYKKMMMKGFAVYWNTRSLASLGPLPLDALLKEMSKYEEVTKLPGERAEGGGEPLTYIIRPVTLSLKLTHNEEGDPRLPLFSADVELPSLAVGVETEQYAQAMAVKHTFDKAQRMALLLPYRPSKPVKEDPAAWWRYAFFCVRKATTSLDMVHVVEMFRKRRLYLQLFEKTLRHQEAVTQAAAVDPPGGRGGKSKAKSAEQSNAAAENAQKILAEAPALTGEEERALDMCEETVPVDALVVWRTLVYSKRRREAKQQQQQQQLAGGGIRRKSSTGMGRRRGTGSESAGRGGKGGIGRTSPAEGTSNESAGARGFGGWVASLWSGGGKGEQGKGRASSDSWSSDGEFEDTMEEMPEEGEEDWRDVQEVGTEWPEEEVQEGDISLNELLAQAEANLPPPPSVQADTELFAVRLQTASTISLYAKRRTPLLELTSSLDLRMHQKGDTFSAAVILPTISLKDSFTPHPLFTHIAQAGAGEGAEDANKDGRDRNRPPIFNLNFSTSPQSTSVEIRTQPLDLVYSRGWLAQVLHLLRPSPEMAEALAAQAVDNIGRATAAVTADVIGKVALRADIEIAAPRIFIPLMETEDRGFLLLDTGHLSVQGGTQPGDASSSEWEVRLSRIQSRLWRRKAEWLLAKAGGKGKGGGTEGQLIEPFEIRVGLAMTGDGAKEEGAADMAVTTSLQPSIRGVFTPACLKSMLAIVTNLGLPEVEEDEDEEGMRKGERDSIPLGEVALQKERVVSRGGVGGVSKLQSTAQSRSPTRSKASLSSIALPPLVRVTNVTKGKEGEGENRAAPESGSESEDAEDPLKKKMTVQVHIPSVVLELQANPSTSIGSPGLGRSLDMESPTDRTGADRGLPRLFIVAMEGFSLDYLARAFDTDLRVALGALSIENLASAKKGGARRFLAYSSASSSSASSLSHTAPSKDIPGSQGQAAAGTEEENEERALVHFHMTTFADREKAPAYPGFDCVIALKFATLDLKCDADSIRLLNPFYAALMRFGEEVPSLPPALPPGLLSPPSVRRTQSVTSNASTHLSKRAQDKASRAAALAAAAAAAAAQQQEGKTMRVTACLKRVSLELLTRSRQPVVMAELGGLTSEVEMGKGEREDEGMVVKVVLQTFEVTDTQPESRTNAIRKLICPKHGVAEEEEEEEEETDEEDEPRDKGRKEDGLRVQRAPLLVAEVREDKTLKGYGVDVTLEDFTLNVLVEALMASIDVTLESVNGLLDVLAAGQAPSSPSLLPSAPAHPTATTSDAPFGHLSQLGSSWHGYGGKGPPMGAIGEGTQEEEEEGSMEGDADHTRLSASALQGMTQDGDGDKKEAEPMGLRVMVRLVNPGLILIENARNYDSRAVSLRGTYQILYLVEHEKPGETGGGGSTVTIHVDAQGLEAYVDVVGAGGMGGKKGGKAPVQILTPFAVGVHIKNQSEQEKLLVSETVLNVDRVLMRVAYHDVRLVQGILGGLSEAWARYSQATSQAAAAAASAMAAAPSNAALTDPSGREKETEEIVGPVWDAEAGGEEYTPVVDLEQDKEKGSSPANTAVMRRAQAQASVNLDALGPEEEGATLGLTPADEILMATKNTALSRTNLDVAGLEVMFINDYDGRDQPLLEINVEKVHLDLEQCADAYKGQGCVWLQARFFNPAVLFWEPVLEPWEVRLDISTEANGIVLEIRTPRVLYLDVTEAFIQTVSRTYSLFLSASVSSSAPPSISTLRSSSDKESDGAEVNNALPLRTTSPLPSSPTMGTSPTNIGAAQYSFTNKTGLALKVHSSSSPSPRSPRHVTDDDPTQDGKRVSPDATVALDVKEEGFGGGLSHGLSDVKAGDSFSPISKSGSRGPEVTVTFMDNLGEERRPLENLNTDVPGVYVYPLKPVAEIVKAYPRPVVVETWENERSDRLTCTWRTPFCPTDRPRWSDEQGKRERKREEIVLPGPEWEWQDDWHVDMGLGEIGREIDEEGWTYGVEFPGFTLNRIKRTYREMDGVRRRRWIRTRVPLPPAIDDPTRPLSVVWRVALLPDGRTELSLETAVQLVNETDVAFEVLAIVDPARPPYPVDPIPAQGSVCMPLLLAYASKVCIRPLVPKIGERQDTSDRPWSSPFLVDRGAGSVEEVVFCPPDSSASQSTPTCVVVDAAITDAGVKSIFLRPAFVFENLLPCHAWVSISPHENCDHTRLLAPGDTAGVLSVTPQVTQTVKIRLAPYGGRPGEKGGGSIVTCGGYEWSQELELGGPPNKFQNLKPFVLANHLRGEEIGITGWVVRVPRSQVRLHMSMYVRCWIVDRTGLNLGFCEDPSKLGPSHAKMGRARSRASLPPSFGGHPSQGAKGGAKSGGVTSFVPPVARIVDLAVENGSRDGKRQAECGYEVREVDNGNEIYTDRPCLFTNLPPRLRRKTALLTPNDDRGRRQGGSDGRVVSFKVSQAAEVYLLYDVSGRCIEGKTLPAWVKEGGWKKAEDFPLIVINTQRHEEGVIKFQAYRKHVDKLEEVVLGANAAGRKGGEEAWKGRQSRNNNYTVLVVQDPAGAGGGFGGNRAFAESASTVLVPSAAEMQLLQAREEEGEESELGMYLYDPRKVKKVSVCVDEDLGTWSKPLDVEGLVDRGVFDVPGKETSYDLSLTISVCPGVFGLTKLVTVTPRFMLVNCLDEEVMVRQAGVEDRPPVLLPARGRSPFYWASKQTQRQREMQIMIPGTTGWSYGGVCLERVGGTAVLLPQENDPRRQTPTVMHVEVKLGEGEEECAVVVALWKPRPVDPPLYAVHNYTPYEVHFVQLDVRTSKPRWVLPPGQTTMYGWEYPCLRHVLFLRLFNPRLPEKKFCCEMYLDKVLDGDVIDMGKGNGRIYLKILAQDGTKVLKIVGSKSMLRPPRVASQRELTLRLSLPGLGLSLVGADEEEGRREIAFFFVNGLSVEYLQGTREKEVEVKIKSVQLDNHVRHAMFPVILCPRTASKEGESFIHFSLLAEVDTRSNVVSVPGSEPSSTTTYHTIRYLAFRVLAMDLQLDLRSLLRYLHFAQQLVFLDFDRANAELHPSRFVASLRSFYNFAEPLAWVDTSHTWRSVTNARVYSERIDLHPLSVALSFVQTVADDKRIGFGGNVMEVVKNLASISRAPLQMKSFQVEHVMETPPFFLQIVLAHYKRQALAQILTIAGSLSTLGSPLDLVTSVGTGVKDFFYEPINGLVHSPQEFAKGLKRGTTSLLKGVVSGALNSVAGVGDSLNRNVAMLAADREYTVAREQRRQAATAGGTGLVDGLKDGGDSFVRGFADGISGVFLSPVKEARTGGIGGFLKGVGKGVVGLAVKPLVGVSDAVVSVIQGASQAAQDLEVHVPVRPRRALPRWSVAGQKVLTDYSLSAALVQERLEPGDAYVCHVSLEKEEKDVIFTDKHLSLFNPSRGGVFWKRPWRDIAWCEVTEETREGGKEGRKNRGIWLHLYRNDNESKGTLLQIDGEEDVWKVYAQLWRHRDRMGNGSMMKSVGTLQQEGLEQEKEGTGEMVGDGRSPQFVGGGLVDGYVFGSKNDQDLRCRKLRSWDIVARARDRMIKSWTTWPELDDAVWKVINDWTKNHWGPWNFRKCMAVLVVNKGTSGVQLQNMQFRDGSEVHVIESRGFEATSRVLSPEGAVLIFAWSHIPSLVKNANIAVRMETTAFKGEFTDKVGNLEARPGSDVSFVEKTRKSAYVKYVVVVRDRRS